VLVAAAAASVSPDQLMSSAVAAAHSQRSVHYVMTAVSPPKMRLRIVGDAALDRGIQQITYSRGAKSGHVTVLVVANTAYVRGDAFVLEHMGFSRASARRVAGRWLKIPHTARRYAPIAEAVRLRSTIKQVTVPRPRVALAESVFNGQRVIGIRNTSMVSGQRVTRTLYVRASGLRVPVAEVERGHGGSLSVTFSKWRQPVTVSVPNGAILVG
jgi:hypothetical protein